MASAAPTTSAAPVTGRKLKILFAGNGNTYERINFTNPYSSAKTISKTHTVRGVKIDGDVNVVESAEGGFEGCDIITYFLELTTIDQRRPEIAQPAYAAQAQRTLLPEILKYMKRLH